MLCHIKLITWTKQLYNKENLYYKGLNLKCNKKTFIAIYLHLKKKNLILVYNCVEKKYNYNYCFRDFNYSLLIRFKERMQKFKFCITIMVMQYMKILKIFFLLKINIYLHLN